jgi:L-threonylcarbamoyladenylate synthase
LLRPGGLPREAITRVLGCSLREAPLMQAVDESEAPLAPGMLASHYAPKARLRLEAASAQPGEALLAFGPALAHSGAMLNLSLRGDLVEAAANLFAHLRALDATGAKTIAVMPIPAHDLGEAINDRLARAAAPRR